MLQDLLDHFRVFNGSNDPNPSTTLFALLYINSEDALQADLQATPACSENAEAAGGTALQPAAPPPMMEIYPSHTLTGRRTTGVSEFELSVPPDNHGVLLRRTLDYGFANQRALVAVEQDGVWGDAGVWYLAGSHTVYHSFPWASNRRFRDDEFLLPASLTRGQTRLRLRLTFAPRNPPLLPGLEPLPSAWTEFAYAVYACVMPDDPAPGRA